MPQTVTRRSFLSLATTALAVGGLSSFATTTDPLVYIGSSSRKTDNGIYTGRWDRRSGTLSDFRLAFTAIGPGSCTDT